MILYNIILGVLTEIAVSNATKTDYQCIPNTGLLGHIYYNVNLYTYIPCIILLLLIYTILWNKVFKNCLLENHNINKWLTVIYVIIYVVLFLNIMIYVLASLISSFADVICNIPKILEIMILFYPIIYPIANIITITLKKDYATKA